MFGVSADQTADVENRLTSQGLRVDAVSAGGDAITVTGTVAQMESAFQVTEKHYVSNGFDFIANTTGPTVWSSDGVFTVIGLDTLQRYSQPKVPGQASTPAANVPAPVAVNSSIALLDTLYDEPAATTGKGQKLTVIGEGDPSVPIADLRDFEAANKGQDGKVLPTVPVIMNCVDKNAAGVGDCGTDTSGNGEWDIDFQASTGMAPDIDSLTLDFSQSLGDTDLDNAFLHWINDPNGSLQASASEGVCEQTPANAATDMNNAANSNETEGTGEALGDNQEPVIDGGLLQAALEGRTLFASTGDTGDTCGAIIVGPIGAGNGVIYNGAPSVDYPAASAWATAVGGTEIYKNESAATPSTTYTEEAWPYSGGGTSMYIAAAPYALANSASLGICVSSPDGSTGNTGKQCRGTADVSAQSGGLLDGYPIYSDGSASTGAGTSLAAPLWQGMWARIQSGATNAPKGFGFANQTIYTIAYNATTYASDFHDITVGANPLPTMTGWDYPTGWGTPDVAHILADANKAGPQATAPPTPEAPLAALIPLVGAAAGVTVMVRRRRRRA